jgi:uncharacterized membrane protein (UPF0182 family)
MQNWKRLLIIAVAVLLAIPVVLLAGGILLTHFLVDLWFFSHLDYGAYFWLRTLYRYFLSGGITLFFFLVFFFNFWAASRFLGVDQEAFSELGNVPAGTRYRNLLRLFQTGSLQVYTPLSLILGIIIAVPFYQQWEAALLFLFGPGAGVQDPVYGNDVSFYLFSYPIFQLIQTELLITSIILTIAIAVLYWTEHQLVPSHKKEWPVGARIHVTGLFFLTALLLVWGFILERYQLLYTEKHEPGFFGPGFVEIRYHLPLIWLSILMLSGAFVAGAVYLHTRKGLKTLLGFSAGFLLVAALRHLPSIPQGIDRFIVKPNPVKTEREFMKNNIEATLAAYDLDKVKTLDVTVASDAGEMKDVTLRPRLHNIPVWDHEYLDDVYRQLQGIRPYYNFPDVDVSRYDINGRTEQVNLAGRELNISRLPQEAQNWENTHLRYTHGYGAVITPAAQRAAEPMQWFLKDLSLHSDVGFRLEKPDIYYGMENLTYAIVPNRLNVAGISSGDVDASQNYTGRGDVRLSSLFRRLLFAIYLRDEKMFFSTNIDENSKVLFRRNVVDRIKTLTPYLSLDHDPYIVVTPQRLYWIQDAYATSDWYPVSKPSVFRFNGDVRDRHFNYIRNSVKIVVDAFDGTVDYYIVDPSDPVIEAYRRAYPGVFKDVGAMPPLLRQQLRYPKDIFSIQMNTYARYHQTQPELFFEQGETWDFAKVNNNIVVPYYLTTSLQGCEGVENFVLINPMTPIGRSNLSALAIGGSLDFRCGEMQSKNILVYKFRKETQVEGSSQISALIDQDPEISQQFALWDQKGSHVIRGRIILLPIANMILYVQPVYLISTSQIKIPELTRVILSMGYEVVMDTTLDRALDRLEERLKIRPPATNGPTTAPIMPSTTRSIGAPPEPGIR